VHSAFTWSETITRLGCDFRAGARYDCRMTLREKILFHQVHPVKLGTDVASAFVSLYFLWQHALIIGLLAHLVPPPVGSAIVMACVDLEPYKNSRLGAYLVRYMRPGAQAARLVGDLIMVVAAWFRAPGGIAVGLLIVIAAWSHGLICLRRYKSPAVIPQEPC